MPKKSKKSRKNYRATRSYKKISKRRKSPSKSSSRSSSRSSSKKYTKVISPTLVKNVPTYNIPYNELLFAKKEKSIDHTKFYKIANITTIKPGGLLYHGTITSFIPDKIRDYSNFATTPYGAVRRWANCKNIKKGEIYIYEIKKEMNLLDIDDAEYAGMKYFREIMDSLGLNSYYHQDDLKKYICENLKDINGYKWDKHENEYAICKPIIFLKYIGKLSCEIVEKLGKDFWNSNPNTEQIIEYME